MRDPISVQLLEGNVAPRYGTDVAELRCDNVVITEQGTQAKLPIVDFQLRDKKGALYYLALTGREINAISAAAMGVIARLHGRCDMCGMLIDGQDLCAPGCTRQKEPKQQ